MLLFSAQNPDATFNLWLLVLDYSSCIALKFPLQPSLCFSSLPFQKSICVFLSCNIHFQIAKLRLLSKMFFRNLYRVFVPRLYYKGFRHNSTTIAQLNFLAGLERGG